MKPVVRLDASHSNQMLPSARSQMSPPSPSVAAESSTETGTGGARPLDASSLGDVMDAASRLNNAGQPREALALLAPRAASVEAQNHFAFQARLGAFRMEIAAELGAANRLGALVGLGPEPGMTAPVPERMAMYVGAISAHAKYLTLLEQPAPRQHFLDKNPLVDLDQHCARVKDGLFHAVLEVGNLYHKLRDTFSSMDVGESSSNEREFGTATFEGSVNQLVQELSQSLHQVDRKALLTWNEQQRAQFLQSKAYRDARPFMMMAPDFLFLPMPPF